MTSCPACGALDPTVEPPSEWIAYRAMLLDKYPIRVYYLAGRLCLRMRENPVSLRLDRRSSHLWIKGTGRLAISMAMILFGVEVSWAQSEAIPSDPRSSRLQENPTPSPSPTVAQPSQEDW